MAAIVLSSDVAAGWRPLTTAEGPVATQLISEAFVLLRVLVPGLDSKSDDLVKLVVVKMVRRVLKNPDGFRVRNESIDDYSDGGTVDSALSTGELYVSTDELGWLGVRASGLRAFQIRPGGAK